MLKYIIFLLDCPVKIKKKQKQKQTIFCLLPRFSAIGQNQSDAIIWRHKSVDKATVAFAGSSMKSSNRSPIQVLTVIYAA